MRVPGRARRNLTGRMIRVPAPLAWCALTVAVAAAPLALAARDEGWVIERFVIQLDIQPDGLDRRSMRSTSTSAASPSTASSATSSPCSTTTTTQPPVRHHPDERSPPPTAAVIRRGRHEGRSGDSDRRSRSDDLRQGDVSHRLSASAVRSTVSPITTSCTGTRRARGRFGDCAATVMVTAPAGAIERVDCFQGPAGSHERCDVDASRPDEATFTATAPLAEGEQLTIVAGLRKGAVAAAACRCSSRGRATSRSSSIGRRRCWR